tara:strand:- start:8862 stop:9158 length:297 start_codon:yes stop_codon:yes gene_type:complete
MKIKKYQKLITGETKKYKKPSSEGSLLLHAVSLAAEVGEVMDEVKKSERDDEGLISKKRRKKLVDELGDVLFYYLRLCAKLNISLEEVIKQNKKKVSK